MLPVYTILGVAGRCPGLPMVVCCSSRDVLDAISSVVANVLYISWLLWTTLLHLTEMVMARDKKGGHEGPADPRRDEQEAGGEGDAAVTLAAIITTKISVVKQWSL
ncbi:hypothetical protein ACFX2I_036460 [Malus domestica]